MMSYPHVSGLATNKYVGRKAVCRPLEAVKYELGMLPYNAVVDRLTGVIPPNLVLLPPYEGLMERPEDRVASE